MTVVVAGSRVEVKLSFTSWVIVVGGRVSVVVNNETLIEVTVTGGVVVPFCANMVIYSVAFVLVVVAVVVLITSMDVRVLVFVTVDVIFEVMSTVFVIVVVVLVRAAASRSTERESGAADTIAIRSEQRKSISERIVP